MALIDLTTADGTTIGNPSGDNYYIFLDSSNSDLLTRRDSAGADTVYSSGVVPFALDNRIIVTQANKDITLGGTIDSSKEYFLDGIIDMGATQITVPSGGINVKGYDFNVSGLISSEDSYTMFTGATAGDILWFDFKIEVTGISSKVLDVTNATGFNAFEISRINFNNCTSLGELNGYRQGLETGTGRFGGTPNLILSGTWLGGYFIETSIIRNLTDGVYSIYEEGTSFTMASRFRTNQNVDLPANASFIDFRNTNFSNPSTVQIRDAIVSRNGVFDSVDANIIPNLTKGELASSFVGNKGIANTFEGGASSITTEVETTIATVNTFVDLAGTYTASSLEHFDAPDNGRLRHLGDTPIEYKVTVSGIIEGGASDEIRLKIVAWDDSASSFVDYKSIVRVVNNLQGGRDVAFFNFSDTVTLDANDYVKIQVANTTDTTNVTAELDTEFIIEQR